MKVNDTRTLSPDALEQLRRRVVAAIRNQAMAKVTADAYLLGAASLNGCPT